MTTSSRRYFSEIRKKDILAEMLASGLTLRGFARDRKISVSVISRWKKELLEVVTEEFRTGKRVAEDINNLTIESVGFAIKQLHKYNTTIPSDCSDCMEIIGQLKENVARVEGERDTFQKMLDNQFFSIRLQWTKE